MIGGRSAWLAWPAGVVCVGVVGALAWLAVPGIPTAVSFVGDILRTGAAASASAPEGPKPVHQIGSAISDDCRSLYPDGLWVELSWTPHVLLDQTQAAPETTATSVRAALSPQVRMTCAWRNESGGTVTTTLSDVDASASGIAQAALASQGFSCEASGGGVRCVKASGAVVEEHVIRDGVWLATFERSWHPDRYTDRLVQRLWP
ncbi:MAG: hypothetical protein J0J05_13770 [Microbacterium sp.]|uniref:hypothetical protein n=1 Tax=Microbacterium sp. TaxID=51671 RepID=UPI001ACAB7C2|nr:hypothetical protein [Microbacterium sp.]MBN9155044.1 hypothetical protein [Microbacterium sp.]